MDHRIALIWPGFSHYHIARLRSLARRIGDRVVGIELIGGKGEDETSQWRSSERNGLNIVTLFPETDFDNLLRKDIGKALCRKLEEEAVNNIFVNGYSQPEFQAVINWAYRKKMNCFTFFETKRSDFPRFFLREFFKKQVIKKLKGALCGGVAHKEYAVDLGFAPDKAVIGYDVVDNDMYVNVSKKSRLNSSGLLKQFGLPDKFFLSASRFVEKKNIKGLLRAYYKYRERSINQLPWGLVLCGGGAMEGELRRFVDRMKINGVLFAGPKEPHELAIYYSLASGFILASTIEQWGLVINEAMASGVPVLATKVASATAELVEDGLNGYVIDPFSIDDMAGKMLKLASRSDAEIREMGMRGQEKVCRKFPLELFAEGVMKLVSAS